MWNPAIEFAERRGGTVRGWHRRFCLWLHGGARLAGSSGADAGARPRRKLRRHAVPHPGGAGAPTSLLLVWRRERFTSAYQPRWVTAHTASGPVRAVTFVGRPPVSPLRRPAGRDRGRRQPRRGPRLARQLPRVSRRDAGGAARDRPARPQAGAAAAPGRRRTRAEGAGMAATAATLAANVMHFVHLLRRAGLPVGPAETLAGQRALSLVDLGDRDAGAHRAARRDGASP
ncbi:MAG: hypothetical protein WDN25_25900 [Acetobacteraceae bacterium]